MKAKFYKFIAYSLHYFKFHSISFQYDNIGCCLINSFNGIQARCDFQLVKSTRCFNRRYDNQQLVWNKSEKEKTVKGDPVIRFLWVSTLFTELHPFQHEGVVLKVHLSTYDDTSPINTITIENFFVCSHDTDNVVVFLQRTHRKQQAYYTSRSRSRRIMSLAHLGYVLCSSLKLIHYILW